jgi:hypothetical protein
MQRHGRSATRSLNDARTQKQLELNEAFGGEEDRFRFSFFSAFLAFFAAFLDFFDFLRLEDEDESESESDDLSAFLFSSASWGAGAPKASWGLPPLDPGIEPAAAN